MNSLGNTLNAMQLTARPNASQTDTAQAQQNGLMAMDGSTTTTPAAREHPLTPEQVMAISSCVRPLLPTVSQKPVYTAATGSDEGGEYASLKQTGWEPEIVCDGRLAISDEARSRVVSALRQGPLKSKRQAITRLAAHKHLASNEAQLTLLVSDYSNDLDEFPEYVVLAVCDFYRLEHTGKFMPTVAEMRKVCRDLKNKLLNELGRQEAMEKPKHVEVVKPMPKPADKLDYAAINDTWAQIEANLKTLGLTMGAVPVGVDALEYTNGLLGLA